MGLNIIIYPLAVVGAVSLLFVGWALRSWVKFKGELEAE